MSISALITDKVSLIEYPMGVLRRDFGSPISSTDCKNQKERAKNRNFTLRQSRKSSHEQMMFVLRTNMCLFFKVSKLYGHENWE